MPTISQPPTSRSNEPAANASKRSKREKVQQQEEPEKTALAMKVGRRELPDQSRQHDGHAEERQRQAVRHQHQGEVIIMHGEPIAEGHRDSRAPVAASPQNNDGERQNRGGKNGTRDSGDDALRRNPAQQPQQAPTKRKSRRAPDHEHQHGLRE